MCVFPGVNSGRAFDPARLVRNLWHGLWGSEGPLHACSLRCWSRPSGLGEGPWSCVPELATAYSCAPGSMAPITKAPGAPGLPQLGWTLAPRPVRMGGAEAGLRRVEGRGSGQWAGLGAPCVSLSQGGVGHLGS